MDINEQFLSDLDSKIQAKHLLKHTFYVAWSEGRLSLECLKEYAKEYYHHVKAFPTYLSALHSHTENSETRKQILQNLIEEEAGSPNHPELWKRFALSLGNTEEEIASHVPSEEITNLIGTFKSICINGSVSDGLAALYSYESQIPPICISKIDGLRQHYGMINPKDWAYFTVHIEADKEHAAVERELIGKHFDVKNVETVNKSADQVLDGLWNFLTSLCERYEVTACSCA